MIPWSKSHSIKKYKSYKGEQGKIAPNVLKNKAVFKSKWSSADTRDLMSGVKKLS
jgi:hypothetical protein